MRRYLNQAGDTLIEVLLAMTVISVILGGGYVLARQSLNDERQAQERGEALQLVQSQIEQLRSLQNLSSPPTPAFCMTSSGMPSATFTPPAPVYPNADYSAYLAACVVNNLGHAPAGVNEEPTFYHLSIIPNNPISNTFNVQAVWDQIGGGQEHVQVLYKFQ